MKGDPLPDEHHVVRLVGGSKIDGGIVHPDAFKDAPLSVNWLECANGTKNEQLDRVRPRIRLQIRPTARFAELNVGKVRGIADEINVVEDPLPAECGHPSAPCHAEIIGFPDDLCKRKRVSEAIADSVITLH